MRYPIKLLLSGLEIVRQPFIHHTTLGPHSKKERQSLQKRLWFSAEGTAKRVFESATDRVDASWGRGGGLAKLEMGHAVCCIVVLTVPAAILP
jgi:hypothetical protein